MRVDPATAASDVALREPVTRWPAARVCRRGPGKTKGSIVRNMQERFAETSDVFQLYALATPIARPLRGTGVRGLPAMCFPAIADAPCGSVNT